MTLDEDTRGRLNAIAARLASDDDGEALQAARLLVRHVTLAGGSVAELFPDPMHAVRAADCDGRALKYGRNTDGV